MTTTPPAEHAPGSESPTALPDTEYEPLDMFDPHPEQTFLEPIARLGRRLQHELRTAFPTSPWKRVFLVCLLAHFLVRALSVVYVLRKFVWVVFWLLLRPVRYFFPGSALEVAVLWVLCYTSHPSISLFCEDLQVLVS